MEGSSKKHGEDTFNTRHGDWRATEMVLNRAEHEARIDGVETVHSVVFV